MIKVTIKNNKEVEITGHAGFAEAGKDIVCASVSSIITTSINAMFLINSDSVDFSDESNVMRIILLDDNEIIYKLLLNMINILRDLESQFPKNIKIIS